MKRHFRFIFIELYIMKKEYTIALYAPITQIESGTKLFLYTVCPRGSYNKSLYKIGN